MGELHFEALTKGHKTDSFDCGVHKLNYYLKTHTLDNSKNNVGRAYVLTNDDKEVYGFYTLNNHVVNYDAYPQKDDYPPYPTLPSLLIGRLAIDKNIRGQGYGEALLINAFKTASKSLEYSAFVCIRVDAKKDSKSFYENYGFKALNSSDPLKLYIPTEKVINSLRALKVNVED